MKAVERISDFTGDRARHRFHTAYRDTLNRLWPEPPSPIPLATSYGEAVAYRAGRTSYGGWAVLCHELDFPGRAASLTLLDPGGFGRLGARFWVWLIAGGLAGLMPRSVRHRLAGPVRNTVLRDDELMPLVPLTMAFRRRLPMPHALTDDELGRITVPTLVMLGERSVLYPAADVAARLSRAMPATRVEIVAGASHDLPAHSPALVAKRIAAFLAA